MLSHDNMIWVVTAMDVGLNFKKVKFGSLILLYYVLHLTVTSSA